MPEYIIPETLKHGSREHALYLTYIISIDYMVNAVILWKNAREEYHVNPENYQPDTILSKGDQSLANIVKRVGARFPNNGAKTWRKISKILNEKYSGDPCILTKQPQTITEIKAKLDEFPYLRGDKLSNFYLRVMGEKELLKITDFAELDIPVDIQVARFTIYTGVLSLGDGVLRGCVHEKPLRPLIEEAWRDAAKSIDTYPWKLDEPIWTIGSKLCSKKKCSKFPVNGLCDQRFDVTFKASNAIWK